MEKTNELHEIVLESIEQSLILLMKRKPLSKITISEVCEKAGVSRVSFYRNFSSFDDVLVKYLKQNTDAWWKEFSKTGSKGMEQFFWSELINLYREMSDFIDLLKKNNVTYILKEHIFLCCGPKKENTPEEAYVLALIAGGIYGVIDEWINRGMKDNLPNVNMNAVIKTVSQDFLSQHSN